MTNVVVAWNTVQMAGVIEALAALLATVRGDEARSAARASGSGRSMASSATTMRSAAVS